MQQMGCHHPISIIHPVNAFVSKHFQLILNHLQLRLKRPFLVRRQGEFPARSQIAHLGHFCPLDATNHNKPLPYHGHADRKPQLCLSRGSALILSFQYFEDNKPEQNANCYRSRRNLEKAKLELPEISGGVVADKPDG